MKRFKITIDFLIRSCYNNNRNRKQPQKQPHKKTKGFDFMTVTIKLYDKCKYNKDSKKVMEKDFTVKGYEVVEISEQEMYSMGYDDLDDFNEYLILTFKDNTKGTFRNSYVDMFKA